MAAQTGDWLHGLASLHFLPCASVLTAAPHSQETCSSLVLLIVTKPEAGVLLNRETRWGCRGERFPQETAQVLLTHDTALKYPGELEETCHPHWVHVSSREHQHRKVLQALLSRFAGISWEIQLAFKICRSQCSPQPCATK